MPVLPSASPAYRDRRDATTNDVASRAVAGPTVEVLRAGMVPYPTALAWQHARTEAIAAGMAREALVLLEHPPVVTLGRRADPAHVLLSPSELEARGIALAHTDRGGDVTFHGPGQLIAYPLLHLRQRGIGPATYVRALEGAVITTLTRWEITGTRMPGRPGVWVGDAKIAAIGVRVRGGVAMHGLALNVSPDLHAFETIVPCGLVDARVTSMAALCGERGVTAPPLAAVADALITSLADALGLHCVPLDVPIEIAGDHACLATGATSGH